MGCEEREWKWREKIQEAWASASRWNSHFHLIFKICFGSSTLWIEIFAEEFWAFMGLYDVILLRWKIVCLLFIYESQGNVKYIPNDAISMKRGDNFDIWILNCCEIGLIWNKLVFWNMNFEQLLWSCCCVWFCWERLSLKWWQNRSFLLTSITNITRVFLVLDLMLFQAAQEGDNCKEVRIFPRGPI